MLQWRTPRPRPGRAVAAANVRLTAAGTRATGRPEDRIRADQRQVRERTSSSRAVAMVSAERSIVPVTRRSSNTRIPAI